MARSMTTRSPPNTRELLFAGTFTTAGLQIEAGAGGLNILKEGKVRKFVNNAEQITYPVGHGVINRAQRAQIITERAVFEVAAEGLVLTEIAKGVDMRRDILEQMEFAPARIVDQPKIMDAALFAH
jgi:propionate CoA-transferase